LSDSQKKIKISKNEVTCIRKTGNIEKCTVKYFQKLKILKILLTKFYKIKITKYVLSNFTKNVFRMDCQIFKKNVKFEEYIDRLIEKNENL